MKAEDQVEDTCIWCGADWLSCQCDMEEDDPYDPWSNV